MGTSGAEDFIVGTAGRFLRRSRRAPSRQYNTEFREKQGFAANSGVLRGRRDNLPRRPRMPRLRGRRKCITEGRFFVPDLWNPILYRGGVCAKIRRERRGRRIRAENGGLFTHGNDLQSARAHRPLQPCERHGAGIYRTRRRRGRRAVPAEAAPDGSSP